MFFSSTWRSEAVLSHFCDAIGLPMQCPMDEDVDLGHSHIAFLCKGKINLKNLMQNQYSVHHILIGLCLLMRTLLLAVCDCFTLCLCLKLSHRWRRTGNLLKWQFYVGYANDQMSERLLNNRWYLSVEKQQHIYNRFVQLSEFLKRERERARNTYLHESDCTKWWCSSCFSFSPLYLCRKHKHSRLVTRMHY